MNASPVTVLDYGQQQRIRMRRILRQSWRALLVIAASTIIGTALALLLMPVVYVDLFRLYEQPPAPAVNANPSRPNALTRAAQFESPTFVQTATAALRANGTLATADLASLEVHSSVDPRTDVIVVAVSHPSRAVAASVAESLVQQARSTALGTAIIEPPARAAQLGPTLSFRSYVVFWICILVPFATLFWIFRRQIFTISADAF